MGAASGALSLIRIPSIAGLKPLVAFTLFVWLAYVVIGGQPNIALHVYPATVRLHILYVGLGLAYLAFLVWRRRLPALTRLDWPLLLLVVVYVAATRSSIYPRISLETALLTGGVLVAFFVFADPELVPVEWLVRGLVATGLAASLISIYQVGVDYSHWLALMKAVGGLQAGDFLPPSVPRVHGVGDHVNLLAIALNLSLPFALVLAFRPVLRFDRPFAVISALLTAITLFLTLSRSAWVAALPGLVVLVVLYSRRERGIVGVERLGAYKRPALLLASVATAVAVVGLGVVALRWDSRPEWLFRSSLSPRYDAISVGFRIFKEKPLLGSGPNTYGLLYNAYSGDYPIENIHPHNGYLDAVDDTGLLGGLVLLTGAVVVVVAIFEAYRTGDAGRRALVAAGAAALTTIAVHSLTDSPNMSKTALLPLALVMAILLRLAPAPGAPVRLFALRNLPRLLPLALVPALAVGWLAIDRAHGRYNQSLSFLEEGNFPVAAAKAIAAADSDPHQGAYNLHAGVAQAIDYLVVQENGGPAPPDALNGVVASFERALADDPRSAVARANLALALRLKDDRTGAVAAARRALDLAPRDGVIGAVAGTVFEWAGLFADARAAYARAITHDAALVQSPFWRTSPFRRAVRSDAIADSLLTDCQKGRVSAMFAGFPDDLPAWEAGCRRRVDASPGDSRARSDLAVVLYGLGRADEALAEARRAVDRSPDDPYARTALGIALSARGGGDRAAARKQFALGAYLGDPDAVLALASTYQAPPAAGPFVANLGIQPENRPLPPEVQRRLAAALPNAAPMVFVQPGIQNYLLGVLYYRTRFLRQSPTSILIPGEWLTLASPRALLMEDFTNQERAEIP